MKAQGKFQDVGNGVSSMTAHIHPEDKNGVIDIHLEGAVFGKDAEHLNRFLKNLAAHYKDVKWVLRLDDLELLSIRALHVLKKFARIARRGGCNVSMIGLQPHLRHTIRDLGFHKLFFPGMRVSELQASMVPAKVS